MCPSTEMLISVQKYKLQYGKLSPILSTQITAPVKKNISLSVQKHKFQNKHIHRLCDYILQYSKIHVYNSTTKCIPVRQKYKTQYKNKLKLRYKKILLYIIFAPYSLTISNMASLGPCSFCSKCGCLENELKFCPKCGVKVRIFPTGRCETTTTPFSLPNFHTFKSQKESERKTFFARKTHAGHKKRKVDDEMATINVGVTKDKGVIKRGETLPLKVPSTASAEDIRLAAVKKHTLFNSRFIHSQSEYILAFKEGSEVLHRSLIKSLDFDMHE